MFKRIKKWFLGVEENRYLHKENERLEERVALLVSALDRFSDANSWHEYYPLDEDEVTAWLGCQKPWLAAERAILQDVMLSGESVPNDETRLENITEEFYAYYECDR